MTLSPMLRAVSVEVRSENVPTMASRNSLKICRLSLRFRVSGLGVDVWGLGLWV